MKRIIWNGICLLSVLAVLFWAGMWVRFYGHEYDCLLYARHTTEIKIDTLGTVGICFRWSTFRHKQINVPLEYETYWQMSGWEFPVFSIFASPRDQVLDSAPTAPLDSNYYLSNEDTVLERTGLGVMGFICCWGRLYNYVPSALYIGDACEFSIPYWFLISLSTVLPIRWLVGWRRERQARWRLRNHLCIQCGYDLRGNVTDICPECGTKFVPADSVNITARET